MLFSKQSMVSMSLCRAWPTHTSATRATTAFRCCGRAPAGWNADTTLRLLQLATLGACTLAESAILLLVAMAAKVANPSHSFLNNSSRHSKLQHLFRKQLIVAQHDCAHHCDCHKSQASCSAASTPPRRRI
jgi:hypothetical protein